MSLWLEQEALGDRCHSYQETSECGHHSRVSQAVQGLLETPDNLYLAAEKRRSVGSITELHRVWCTMVSTLGLYKRNPHLKNKESELRELSRVLSFS